MPTECWLAVPSHPAYEVSDLGRVRHGARVLKPQRQSRGYLKLNLGRRHQQYVHTLVAAAFLGPRPAGHEVDHLDWDRHHNSLTNLRYLPALENAVRWAGRAGARNLWLVVCDDDAPEGFIPMSTQEHDDTVRELLASGW